MISTNFNISLLRAQSYLSLATKAMNKSLTRLSTGLRINSAADDAAGYYVGSQLNTQLRGLKQAQNNISMGVSYLGVAEGSLGNMTNILNRLRDLAVEGSNGTISAETRNAMQKEADALLEELIRVRDSAEFNDKKVFGDNAVNETGGITDTVPSGYTAIYTAEDLKNIENNLSGKYILMNDIDLSGTTWTPIADYFTGTLDGNGYAIKNMKTNSFYGGLFEMLAGTVKNLGLENVNITGTTESAGAISAMAGGSGAVIQNCYATGTVNGAKNTGGLIGSGEEAEITVSNSYFSGTVNGDYAGGLVGYSKEYRTKISNSYAQGAVNGSSYVGGLTGGTKEADIIITNSYASNKLTGGSIGGLVGRSPDVENVTSSFWDTEKSGTTWSNGGALTAPDATGLTTAQMKAGANYATWDDTIWETSGGSVMPPRLKNVGGQPDFSITGTGNVVRLQIGANSDATTNSISIDTGLSFGNLALDFSSETSCASSIDLIDSALSVINKKTSEIGAVQNRLESIYETNAVRIENYTSSYSTIMDSDVAEETTSYVKNQLLQQTASSLIAQTRNMQQSLIWSLISSL